MMQMPGAGSKRRRGGGVVVVGGGALLWCRKNAKFTKFDPFLIFKAEP